MNKLIAFFAVLLLMIAVVSGAALGRSVSTLPYPEYLGGTHQHYSVIYDDELEAAVAARLAIENSGSANLSSIVVEIPGSNIRLIAVLQEVRSPSEYCAAWEEVCTNYSDGVCKAYEKRCSYWQPDYYSTPKFYSLNKSVEQLSFSAKYVVELGVPVSPSETATLVLYYKASGLASESLGASDFAFETVKIPYDTDNVRVAINTQPDTHIKGSQSKVRSLPNFEVASSFARTGTASPELNSLSSSIVYQSGYVRHAYSLDPWESFVVEGSYSRSWLALYWRNVMLWSFVGVAALASIAAAMVFAVRKVHAPKTSPAVKVALLSLGSGICTIIVLAILAWLLIYGYGYSYYSGFTLAPLFLLLMLITLLAGLLVPSIYAASKYGYGMGLLAFAATFFVVAFVIAALYFILLLFSSAFYVTPGVMEAVVG